MTKYYERCGVEYCKHCDIEKEHHRYNCVRAQFDKDMREGKFAQVACMYCGENLKVEPMINMSFCLNKECSHYSFNEARTK